MALTIKQLKARKQGLGGSDVAAILGLSKWATPLDIYIDKISEEVEEQELTNFQEWGNRLEPLIIEKFTDATGLKCSITNKTFKHPKHQFMLANVDALIPEENAILECKTVNSFGAQEWGIEGTDQIPDYYLTQCIHYAEVLDAAKVYIAVLIGGNDFRIYQYERNHELGNLIIEKEKTFWEQHIKKEVPPSPSTHNDIKNLWNKATEGKSIKGNSEVQSLIEKLTQLQIQRKILDKEIEEIKHTLSSFMKDAEQLLDHQDQIRVTWKNQSSCRVDVRLLKEEYPDIFAQCQTTTKTRILKVIK